MFSNKKKKIAKIEDRRTEDIRTTRRRSLPGLEMALYFEDGKFTDCRIEKTQEPTGPYRAFLSSYGRSIHLDPDRLTAMRSLLEGIDEAIAEEEEAYKLLKGADKL